MKVLAVIVGAILFCGGVSMLFTPLTNLLSLGIFLAILLLVYGVFGIINSIVKKVFKVNFVFSIIGVLLGIFMLVKPISAFATEAALLIILDIFFIIKGIVEIYTSIRAKASAPHTWGWGLALGIITVLVGIWGLANPLILATAAGLMVAFFFMSTGLNTISYVAVASVFEDAVEEVSKEE